MNASINNSITMKVSQVSYNLNNWKIFEQQSIYNLTVGIPEKFECTLKSMKTETFLYDFTVIEMFFR